MANVRDDLALREMHGDGPGVGLPIIVLTIVTLGALLHPHPMVLGVLAAILVGSGFAMAGIVLVRNRWKLDDPGERMIVPGLLVFFGFVAATLCDIDRATQTLSHIGG